MGFPYRLNVRCGTRRSVKVWGQNVQKDGVAVSCDREAMGSGRGVGAQMAPWGGESAIKPPPGDTKELAVEVLSSGNRLSCR